MAALVSTPAFPHRPILPAPHLAAPHLTARVALLLDAARQALETDREAAKASIARAADLLQTEIDRHSVGANHDAPSGTLAGWQIRRVQAFIDAHIDETIHIKDLGKVAQRSAAHFCRTFRQTFGETPHAYIVRRRLDRASHLMLTSQAALSEIAQACGFADQSHLCKLFRQSTGQSPATWRREHREAITMD